MSLIMSTLRPELRCGRASGVTVSSWKCPPAPTVPQGGLHQRAPGEEDQLGSSEGGSAPLPKPPPDAGRAGGRRGAGAPPSEASNLRIAPAKPALEAEHSCWRGHGNYLDSPLSVRWPGEPWPGCGRHHPRGEGEREA